MHTARTFGVASKTAAHTRRRGSTLLMVVAFLTILALLGTTFLLVCRRNRTQSVASADLNATNRIVYGVRSYLEQRLIQDLYFTPNNTFGKADIGSSDIYRRLWETSLPARPHHLRAWRGFRDFPSPVRNFEQPDYADYDTIISAFEADKTGQNGSEQWLHLSRIFWDASSETARTDEVSQAEMDSSDEYVDTDGDGIKDAYLRDTSATDSAGNKYKVAVRLIDLSGLVSVNTAYGTGASVNDRPICQPYVTLDVGGQFDLITGNTGSSGDLVDYYDNCICRLGSLDENSPYRPFFFDDEPHLRWLDTGTPFDRGRFYETCVSNGGSELAPVKRKYLTTFTSSFSRLRKPWPEDTDSFDRFNLNTILGKYGTAAAGAEPVAGLQQIAAYLASTVNDAAIQQQMLHFTANAWAYADGQSQDKAYMLDVNEYTCHGVVPQPVLTEAYIKAAHKINAAGDGYEPTLVQAVEIHNPYFSANTFSGASYRLIQEGGDLDRNITSEMNSNEYIYVVHNEGDDSFFVPKGGVRIDDTNLDLSAGPVRLVRDADDTGGNARVVPMDVIDIGDLPDDPAVGAETVVKEKIVERDTSKDNMRYIVAKEAIEETEEEGDNVDENTVQNHTIGAANGDVQFDDEDFDDHEQFKTGFHILQPRPDQDGLLSTGELFGLFVTGPTADESLPKQLADESTAYWKSYIRGMADFLRVREVEEDGQGANLCNDGTIFPDLPWPLIVGETIELLGVDRMWGDGNPVVYGKININTAPKQVLEKLPWVLPWPVWVENQEMNVPAVNAGQIAKRIVDFRNNPYDEDFKLKFGGDHDEHYHRGAISGNANNPLRGFLTPSELLIPLENYLREDLNIPPNDIRYPLFRHVLYRNVANLVTVRSNTFAAYITVRQYDANGNGLRDWHYLDIIDRSNCTRIHTMPNSMVAKICQKKVVNSN